MTIYIFCLIEAEGNESADHELIYGWVTAGRGAEWSYLQ